MVVGASGQRMVNVASPVVGARKLGPAPAPTHPPLRMERSVKENLSSARDVKRSHAKV